LGAGAVAVSDAVQVVKQLYVLQTTTAKMAVRKNTPEPLSGETSATERGRDAHDQYDPGPEYVTDRQDTRLGSGKYPDAIDFDKKIVRELKPNNSRKIREGAEQAKKYLDELKERIPGNWRYAVDTYEELPDGTFKYTFGKLKKP
jgi:hypothetical protein